MLVLVRTRDLIHTELVPIFYYRDKTPGTEVLFLN